MAAGFEQLRVWQEARRLAGAIYRITEAFPSKEQYGIISQLRRAGTSIMSNIAEGQGRYSRPELIRFLYISRGSLMEVRSLCVLSCDLGYLKDADSRHLEDLCRTVGVMLNGLIESTSNQVRIGSDERRRASTSKYQVRGTKYDPEKEA